MEKIEDRSLEINTALNLIENICIEADIVLIPYETKIGKTIAVYDNKTEKTLCIVKNNK
ncbi:hypothetical protein VB566_00215 [Clostridium perfringens]|uniref:hypothetical protein n=1 Tax=Clostridium perfringens TaxID=1502 RepID=UPI002B1F8236|nr:hypothetical protein [Clostridium perfringens]MEA5269387.1 hypothetical protein [Clostridium perfringens]MEA5309310.1 hypothetical protein [Clostridium perfringens]MEA5339867.1 hypothetical protein [Clostridium perfringens]